MLFLFFILTFFLNHLEHDVDGNVADKEDHEEDQAYEKVQFASLLEHIC